MALAILTSSAGMFVTHEMCIIMLASRLLVAFTSRLWVGVISDDEIILVDCPCHEQCMEGCPCGTFDCGLCQDWNPAEEPVSHFSVLLPRASFDFRYLYNILYNI